MKTTTTALRSHLDQDVTAMCTCWTITRMDNTVMRFTDADVDVTQDGDVYKSIGAYKRTAIENTSTLSVDNLDIVGSASDLALPEKELRAGLFDNAKIEIFMTPWLESVRGQLQMRRGFFGEVRTLQNGTYQVELRGVMQRLSHNYMDIFSSTCLYDLGEPSCGINIKGPDISVGATFSVGDGARAAQDTHQTGKAYTLPVQDGDFETVGASGALAESLYWFQGGPTDMGLSASDSYSHTSCIQGGIGNSALIQDVVISEVGGLPVVDVDAGSCYLTTNLWRKDSTDEGRLRIQFLDVAGTVLGYGQQFAPTTSYTPTQVDLAGDFTVEMYVRHSTAPVNGQALFGWGELGGGGVTGNVLAYVGGHLTFSVDDNILLSTERVRVQSDTAMPAGEWTHIALTRSGSDLFLYQDFTLVGSGTFSGDIHIDEWFGADSQSNFDGTVDEIRVWDAYRDAYEIGLNARNTLNPATANLIRYHSFNDASGADLTGTDAVFSFGAVGIIADQGSPVAVASNHASALGTATYNSGYSNVGTDWVEMGVADHKIPAATRSIRLLLETNVVVTDTIGTKFDNLTGHIINTNEAGSVLGYMTDDVAWKCTVAGTTDAAAISGGVGDTVVVGTAAFVGENAYLRGGKVLKSDDARTFIARITDPRAVRGWYNEGSVTFETGDNAGVSMEVKSWDNISGEISLFLSLPYPIKSGDLFSIYPGCDKSRISCAAIFNNVENMFATPDVPGHDELYKYPDSK